MVHATTLFEVSRGEIHGRQFALFIKFMQCFFKVSASATADDCIALHCIALHCIALHWFSLVKF